MWPREKVARWPSGPESQFPCGPVTQFPSGEILATWQHGNLKFLATCVLLLEPNVILNYILNYPHINMDVDNFSKTPVDNSLISHFSELISNFIQKILADFAKGCSYIGRTKQESS